jgi:hypothetical protein
MDVQTRALPSGFEDLECLLAEWGELETQDQRYLRRQGLPMERLTAYYAAVCPCLQAIFEHLDGFAFDAPLPAPEARLQRLVMGMSEVAQAVEVYGRPGLAHIPVGHSVQFVTLARA